MNAEAVEKYLDKNAVLIRKDAFLHAWISHAARDSHAKTAEQIKLFAALFSVLADAFQTSGLQLNKSSGLQRIENTELLELGFWICRPLEHGPSYMVVVLRANETRAWQADLEQALGAK